MTEDFTSMFKSKEEGLRWKVMRIYEILECEYNMDKIKNQKTFK